MTSKLSSCSTMKRPEIALDAVRVAYTELDMIFAEKARIGIDRSTFQKWAADRIIRLFFSRCPIRGEFFRRSSYRNRGIRVRS